MGHSNIYIVYCSFEKHDNDIELKPAHDNINQYFLCNTRINNNYPRSFQQQCWVCTHISEIYIISLACSLNHNFGNVNCEQVITQIWPVVQAFWTGMTAIIYFDSETSGYISSIDIVMTISSVKWIVDWFGVV